MQLKDLYKLKYINVLLFGSILRMKVIICPAVKLERDEYTDCTCIELVGKYNNQIIKTDIVHTQKDLDHLKEIIKILE